MKVLQRLTVANLRQNKRRTAVTVIGIMLSSALILAVVGIVTSLQQLMINSAVDGFGDFHEMFQEVPVENLKYIQDNKHVSSIYYSSPLDPKRVDTEMMDYYELYQNEPYQSKHYERLDQLPADAKGKYNVFVRFDRPKEYKKLRANIQETIESASGVHINTRTNSDLLGYEAGVFGDATLKTLYSLAAIVIGIIIVTSIFVIRNSFSISASERSRQFGMLSSVGATPRQIRHSIVFEGLVIAGLGIPLGIILGIAAVAILVMIMNFLLGDMINGGGAITFAMPLWVFPVAIALSLVTILLSSLLPAIRTAKIPPIEAIRGNNDIKVKAKKLRTPKFIKRTFGIGGVIASKNLKRSRKKYRTTVVSLVISVATFIALASFLDYGKNMVGVQYTNSELDLIMQSADREFYRELQDRFDLQDSTYYFNHEYSYGVPITVMQHDAFAKYAKTLGIAEKDITHAAILKDRGLGLKDNGSYEMVNYTNLKPGEAYRATIKPETPAKCIHYEHRTSEEYGDYTIDITDEACVKAEGAAKFEIDIPITNLVDDNHLPLGLEGYRSPAIFISENYYQIKDLKYSAHPHTEFFAANVDDMPAVIDYIEQQVDAGRLKGVYYSDVEENTAQMRRMYILICIFLYGFIVVVMLIGVTNIFNTITTNIALRAKEFAMLKSIGMTSSEFTRMVRLESIMYSSKALLIGLPIGIGLSYLIYLSVANSIDFGYLFPWVAILIAIFAVAVLVGAIMRYSVKQVEKQNIIETIRSENI